MAKEATSIAHWMLANRAIAASRIEMWGPGRGNPGCVEIGLVEEEEQVDLETEMEAAQVKVTGEEVEVVSTQATV